MTYEAKTRTCQEVTLSLTVSCAEICSIAEATSGVDEQNSQTYGTVCLFSYGSTNRS